MPRQNYDGSPKYPEFSGTITFLSSTESIQSIEKKIKSQLTLTFPDSDIQVTEKRTIQRKADMRTIVTVSLSFEAYLSK